MRILELTDYSAGGCGVFARAIEESKMLSSMGHKVSIFSSNHVKGSGEIAKPIDMISNVHIKRFPALKLGGESYMHWFSTAAENKALAFKPDVIIAHSYRHPHTLAALRLKRKLKCKAFLVTHAPFNRTQRGFLANISVKIYDALIARKLNNFDKVLAITKWEMPYLMKLGLSKDKIEYVPNGIREKFFTYKKSLEKNNIIYTGRISPIKQIESLLWAVPHIKDNKIKIEIFGPAEPDYLERLSNTIKEKNIKSRVIITNKVYSIEEQIEKLDTARIFILPSKSEGMPQVLIEAMSRGKIVLASDNLASKDLIQDGKNGFLFQNGNSQDLAKKINLILSTKQNKLDKIRSSARKSVEKFSWDKIINKLVDIIK